MTNLVFNTSNNSNSQPPSSSAVVSSPSGASFNNSMVDSTAAYSTGATASNTSQLFDFALSDLNFGSTTIGLEYGFLGNMLQNPLLDLDTTATATSAPTTTAPMHLSTIGMQQMMANNGYSSSMSPASSTTTSVPFYDMTFSSQMQHQQQQQQPITPNHSRSSPLSDSTSMLAMKRPSNASSTTSASGRRKGYGNTPEETYTGVKRPFNYAEGFHYLIQHVRDK
ncbi:hypothetical protein MBANPS3_000275 [Mucor bainieri]